MISRECIHLQFLRASTPPLSQATITWQYSLSTCQFLEDLHASACSGLLAWWPSFTWVSLKALKDTQDSRNLQPYIRAAQHAQNRVLYRTNSWMAQESFQTSFQQLLWCRSYVPFKFLVNKRKLWKRKTIKTITRLKNQNNNNDFPRRQEDLLVRRKVNMSSHTLGKGPTDTIRTKAMGLPLIFLVYSYMLGKK